MTPLHHVLGSGEIKRTFFLIRLEFLYNTNIDLSQWLSSRYSISKDFDSNLSEVAKALSTIEKGRDSIFEAASKELETGLHSSVRGSRSKDRQVVICPYCANLLSSILFYYIIP